MKNWRVFSAWAVMIAVAFAAGAQQASTVAKPLVLTGTIPLEGMRGRFDHFGFGRGRVFVAELGSNAVEVINVGASSGE